MGGASAKPWLGTTRRFPVAATEFRVLATVKTWKGAESSERRDSARGQAEYVRRPRTGPRSRGPRRRRRSGCRPSTCPWVYLRAAEPSPSGMLSNGTVVRPPAGLNPRRLTSRNAASGRTGYRHYADRVAMRSSRASSPSCSWVQSFGGPHNRGGPQRGEEPVGWSELPRPQPPAASSPRAPRAFPLGRPAGRRRWSACWRGRATATPCAGRASPGAYRARKYAATRAARHAWCGGTGHRMAAVATCLASARSKPERVIG
jgi:hypothetical protein